MPLILRTIPRWDTKIKQQNSNLENPQSIILQSNIANVMGVLQQLGQLATYAGQIFDELIVASQETNNRLTSTSKRIDHLLLEINKIDRIASDNKSNCIKNIKLYTEDHFLQSGGFFTMKTVPKCIKDKYEHCERNPAFELMGLGVNTLSLMKGYSNPDFFFEEWMHTEQLRQAKLVEERQERRQKRKEMKAKTRELKLQRLELTIETQKKINIKSWRDIYGKGEGKELRIKPEDTNINRKKISITEIPTETINQVSSLSIESPRKEEIINFNSSNEEIENTKIPNSINIDETILSSIPPPPSPPEKLIIIQDINLVIKSDTNLSTFSSTSTSSPSLSPIPSPPSPPPPPPASSPPNNKKELLSLNEYKKEIKIEENLNSTFNFNSSNSINEINEINSIEENIKKDINISTSLHPLLQEIMQKQNLRHVETEKSKQLKIGKEFVGGGTIAQILARRAEIACDSSSDSSTDSDTDWG